MDTCVEKKQPNVSATGEQPSSGQTYLLVCVSATGKGVALQREHLLFADMFTAATETTCQQGTPKLLRYVVVTSLHNEPPA